MGRQEVGGRAAAPIWLYFAEQALRETPVEVFPVPEGIVFVRVDPKTGDPAHFRTREAILECFLEGTTPEGAEIIEPDRIPGMAGRSDPVPES